MHSRIRIGRAVNSPAREATFNAQLERLGPCMDETPLLTLVILLDSSQQRDFFFSFSLLAETTPRFPLKISRSRQSEY
jgi:hypothetical protein